MYSLFHSSFLLLVIIGFVFVDISTPFIPFTDEETKITYPFREDDRFVNCTGRGFELNCTDKNNPVMKILSEEYRVLNINVENQNQSLFLIVVRTDILLNDGGCSEKLANTILDYATSNINLTFASDCTAVIPYWVPEKFRCRSDGFYLDGPPPEAQGFHFDDTGALYHEDMKLCQSRIEVPVLLMSFQDVLYRLLTLEEASKKGFGLIYKEDLACVKSRGDCEYNYNPEEDPRPESPDRSKSDNRKKVVMLLTLIISAAGIGFLMVILCCFRRKFSANTTTYFFKKETLTHQNVEAFLRNNGPLTIRRYSYSDIKKMTNSFRDKLGQGGYGGVYKGELKDGSLVAVKVLKESKGDGEEFINEVASISRTSHVNIVTLMGFCFEGSKRALIYEFMPNGSLEKFIYKENPSNVDRQLGWETLYKVSIGVARGLEYLHQGCNTRILHFDIKPHNILLDEEFCPKISDFGLAKICPRKESIISMVGARGTVGFIAPEVFCRSFGGVSHKSDVYSYGMMVLEMVGGRKNVDASIDHTSEIYFPHWIYKRLEVDTELGLKELMNEKDEESARKMIVVGLWCIQTDPSNRPTISKVLEMLEGNLNFLQIPPKPFVSSPLRSPADSSTITVLPKASNLKPIRYWWNGPWPNVPTLIP